MEKKQKKSDTSIENMAAVAQAASKTCQCFHARMEARRLTRAYDEAIRPSGLRITQFTVLSAVIGAAGKLNITELAELTGMDRTTYSRSLGPLLRQGLIQHTEELSGRDRGVVMTEEGLRRYADAVPLWSRVQKEHGVKVMPI